MEHVQHSPYHEQIREKVVSMHLVDGHTPQQIAHILGHRPCLDTVCSILDDYVYGIVSKEGRKGIRHSIRKCDSVARGFLVDLVFEDPSRLLQEFAELMTLQTGRDWSEVDVCRGLRELGFVRVRTTKLAMEARLSLQQQHQQLFADLHVGPDQILFMDETAADSKVVNRDYAWVLKGFKSATSSLFVRGERFTCVTAMSADGLCGEPLIIKGACDMDMFTEWFATQIVPALEPYPCGKRCVVVMDNCAIHNKQIISQLCSNVGAIAVFLPPYSPAFNPIEQLFGKLKQFFRSSREFVRQVSPVGAILSGLSTITAGDCERWIRGVECYNTPYSAQSG